MSIIIPYNESYMNESESYFSEDGKNIHVFDHEQFARDYCLGPQYDDLKDIKSNSNKYDLDTLRRKYNIPNKESIKNIDLYRGSKLSKKMLEILNEYEKSAFFYNTYDDFLINILHFDRVETYDRKIKQAKNYNFYGRIYTVSNEPHIRFYNYYLMDVVIDTPLICFFYHLIENEFEQYYVLTSKDDNEAKKELDDIKRRVKREDRPYFFK